MPDVDYLVQTPPGEELHDLSCWEPPSLLSAFEAQPTAAKKALAVRYIDLASWKLMNIPGRVPDVSIDFHGDCTGLHLSFFRLPLEEELKAMEADGLPPPNNWLCESQKNSVEDAEGEFEDCDDWGELEEAYTFCLDARHMPGSADILQ
ncbi:hypothetical protein AK812_SmicGene29981 [Symbiodinium microadriaticum]|uniref:Uncharacterized protein n=1 Tax=Symbiodinium microadriaticum TaxID=2951 RepID=A0A1Q9D0H1_SYMMI|nr:hypothetical protein AK812_SmicGene29981 [Symbiodinium microadriaticum]